MASLPPLARAALAAALFLPTPALAAGAFVVQESGRSYPRLQDAVAAIGEGTGTIAIAPGTYRDCAVQGAGQIVYRALRPGSAILDGGICEGKAALVLRGRGARVEGIVFSGMAVADGNGAGIRLERGDLTVTDSLFRNSQQGILTGSDPAHAITLDHVSFSGLGRCDGDQACAHSLYVGGYGSLIVRNCRFEAGTGGHYLKSRARRVEIVDNSFDDSRGRATNYMIDLPNGATGVVSGNLMVQGRDKDNASAFIALGAEGASQSSDGLRITGNDARFVPGVQRRSALLADWTRARIALGTNQVAPGIVARDQR